MPNGGGVLGAGAVMVVVRGLFCCAGQLTDIGDFNGGRGLCVARDPPHTNSIPSQTYPPKHCSVIFPGIRPSPGDYFSPAFSYYGDSQPFAKLESTMRKRLADWWDKNPIHIPRWILSAKYSAFVILALLSGWSGIVTFQVTTFEGFTTVWSALLLIASTVALAASFESVREPVEKWAALVAGSLLATWSVAAIIRALAEGDMSRVTGGFTILIISMLPLARAVGLMRVGGK